VKKQATEFPPAIYPGNYDASLDIVEIIPKLPEHVEVEMQSIENYQSKTQVKDIFNFYMF
jgi:hypothetical protein